MVALLQDADALRKPLPPLREELQLHAGPRAVDGSPTWVIEDPLSGRYFSLGWLEFEVISRWHLGSLQAIGQDLAEHTLLDVDAQALQGVMAFLLNHQLLQIRGPQGVKHLQDQLSRQKQDWWRWLLKNYLFLRVPLVKPSRFLQASWPAVRWIWTTGFAWMTLMCGLIGLYLVSRQWDGFLATFPYFFSLQGLLAMGLALMAAKVIHELGHAFTATRYGCPVPTMGVAFLVMWPVLYTDTSTAWRLRDRQQRLAIGAAGMGAELALAAYALLAWSLLPDGPLRSAVFLLATTTWMLTLMVNLNPLMRFDGYYLLSDWMGMPNLQERAFAYGQWQLREWLFGWGDMPPETLAPERRRWVLLYAYATWIYRFLLFLGIALLVYHFFFKVLGIFLMLVELWWFIAMPIHKELKLWVQRRQEGIMRPRGKAMGAALLILLLVLLFPWRLDIQAPSVWRAAEHTRLYPKVQARVESLLVREGDSVQQGQTLATLSAPDLDFEIHQGQRTLESLSWLVQYRGLNPELLARSRVAMTEFQSEYAAQLARLAERASLTIVSPHDGVVRDVLPGVQAGDWLSAEQALAVIVQHASSKIEAYVSEEEVSRLVLQAEGIFYPKALEQAPFAVRVVSIDSTATTRLSEAYLGSIWGGDVAVRESQKGEWVPQDALYRIELEPMGVSIHPDAVLTGTAVLEGERQSILLSWGRRLWALLLRESGF